MKQRYVKNIIVASVLFILSVISFLLTDSPAIFAVCVSFSVFFAVSFIYLRICVRNIKISWTLAETTVLRKKTTAKMNVFVPKYALFNSLGFTVLSQNLTFGTQNKRNVLLRLHRGENRVEIPVDINLCGRMNVEFADIMCVDLFDFWRGAVKHSLSKNIIVYPGKVNVGSILSRRFIAQNEGNVYDRYKSGSDTSEILELRSYTHGDSVKSIHWKLSSKVNTPLVKIFSHSTNLNALIFCNVSLMQDATRVNEEFINDSIALSTAISNNLIRQGVCHVFCSLTQEANLCKNIESVEENLNLVSEIMDLKIANCDIDSEAVLLSLGLCEAYSKIIYVTKAYNEENMRLIARDADVSVILVNDEGINSEEQAMDYTVISLSQDTLYSRSHNINL